MLVFSFVIATTIAISNSLLTQTGPQIRMHNQKIIFLFLNQNICCVYSKEPSQRVSSFEHPEHMLKPIEDIHIFTLINFA